jgi:hypothetical protein
MEVLSLSFKLLITIIFSSLNKSMLKLFVPIQKFTSKLKRKSVYSGIVFIGAFIIVSIIADNYNLGYIGYGILFGLVNSLLGICFSE